MHFELSPEQAELQETITDFAQAEIAPVAEELDRKGEFPVELFRRVGEMGVMSIPFPEERGGMGLGVFEATLAIEALARADQSIAVSTMVSMATGLTVERFGSDTQKQQWLPEIVSGQKICSIAGTEPGAGSDTGGFTTRATQLGNGQWSLSGEGIHHQRRNAHFAFHTGPRDQFAQGGGTQEVFSVPDPEQRAGLHTRQGLQQDGLAQFGHPAALP